MKSKLILLSSAALATVASGQTVVDITGSTAGRAAVHAEILSVLTGETFVHDNTGTPTNPGGATRAIYVGNIGATPYIIRTSWSGSVNGVRDVAQQNTTNNTFFDPNDPEVVAALGTPAAGTSTGAALTSSGNTAAPSAATAPEIGFSDVFQTSTAFTTPALAVEDEVGVIPFKWFKNDGAPAGLTGMTPSTARALYGSLGELPLSLFTGLAADQGSTVYCTGRNSDSGSRITTMAEAGYGVFALVNQYTGTVAADTITLSVSAGDAGFGSGGGVAGLLAAKYAGGAVVGYLGGSDWATAVNGGATELSWNGVTLGTTDDAADDPNVYGWQDKIRQGSYTFWGYLHMNRMALSGAALTFYNSLKNGLVASPPSPLIKESTMAVSREGDGAPVNLK